MKNLNSSGRSAAPIGVNVRSTVARYADVHDELRKAYARTPILLFPSTKA